MLLNYRTILIGLGAISPVLCSSPQSSDDGISTSDFSSPHEHLEHEPPLVSNLDSSPLTTTESLTDHKDGTPDDFNPVAWEAFHGSGDDADEEFMSLFSFRILATQEPSNRSTASATSPSSTTSGITSSTGPTDPIQAALDWLTSTTNSTNFGGKSASATSKSSTGSKGPHPTTTISTTTMTTTTDPAKAALDWLTSGIGDKSATSTTTANSKHSSDVSAILSKSHATHTSAAGANRLGPRFW